MCLNVSIPCDVGATYDPDDMHVYAVACTYEACLTESPASRLACTTPSATPLEGDEKLPNVIGLQMLSVQEPSLEQDARNDVFPPVLKNVKVINQYCSISAKRNWKR